MPKARLEALVDGIFAIAMTILVLEVKVPIIPNGRSPEELLVALQKDWLTIGAYFISFAFLGMFWVWHHRIAVKIKELDGVLLACSLFFLSLVSFFPFVAGVFGHYPANPITLAIYFPTMGLLLFSQIAFFRLAMLRGKLWEDLTPEMARIIHRKNLKGFVFFLLGILPGVLRIGMISALVVVMIGLATVVAYRRV